MTNVLGSITKGKTTRPHLMLVYGPDGVGKGTLAAGAPGPVFLEAERGNDHLDVAHQRITSLAHYRDTLRALTTEPHEYQTVVTDTLDWLESMIYAEVVADDGLAPGTSIDKVDKGYGKGRIYSMDKWREIIALWDACRDKGLNIILLAHSMVKKFEDPSTPQGYERYQLKLQDGAKTDAAGLIREYVDAVLFMHFETLTAKDDTRRGIGDGSVILNTERRPGFDAKNRLGLPFEIPIERAKSQDTAPTVAWGSLSKYLASDAPSEPVTLQELQDLAGQMTDPAKRAAALKRINEAKPAEYAGIKAKVLIVVNQGRK